MAKQTPGPVAAGTPSARTDTRCGRFMRSLRNNLLLILLLASTVLGVALGAILRNVGPFREPGLHPRELMYLQFPGQVVINIMKLITLPMIFCSLISGIGALESGASGKIGLRTLCYYVGTSTLAISEGLCWIFAVRPGGDVTLPPLPDDDARPREYSSVDGFLDMIRNIFPDNLVTMTFQLVKTEITWKEVNVTDPETNTTKTVMIEEFSLERSQGINMLGTAVCALLLGAMLQSVGAPGRPLLNAFEVLFDILMRIIQKIFYVAPVGLMFMIAATVVEIEDPVGSLLAMFRFLCMVLAAEATHFFITMPLLLWAVTRTNPYKYMFGCLKAFGMAFASNNSNMTLPLTMDCLENNLKKNPRIIRFLCPIGATVNMDGFALYESMVVIFFAQLRGMNLGVGEVLTVAWVIFTFSNAFPLLNWVMSLMISIGAATTSSGLVIYMLLMQSIGLPVNDVFLVVPFDAFLGRIRTCVNVWGDCVGVAVIEKLSQKDLVEAPAQQTEVATDLEMHDCERRGSNC